MQTTEKRPLILTLTLDTESKAFFNRQRRHYFPPERNYLDAHLTLFHQLPDEIKTFQFLENILRQPFTITVTGLLFLGAGVAYRVESYELMDLHQELSRHFAGVLIPQDKQAFRPHITIQNKVTPAAAKATMQALQQTFKPFTSAASGLGLWTYLGGPWEHRQAYCW